LTAERLAKAINECVSGQRYYGRASEIAEAVKKQDSRRLAAEYIETTYFNTDS